MSEAATEGASENVPELADLIAAGEVEGVLLLSTELRATVTPRELNLIRQAFEAGMRIGRADAEASSARTSEGVT